MSDEERRALKRSPAFSEPDEPEGRASPSLSEDEVHLGESILARLGKADLHQSKRQCIRGRIRLHLYFSCDSKPYKIYTSPTTTKPTIAWIFGQVAKIFGKKQSTYKLDTPYILHGGEGYQYVGDEGDLQNFIVDAREFQRQRHAKLDDDELKIQVHVIRKCDIVVDEMLRLNRDHPVKQKISEGSY